MIQDDDDTNDAALTDEPSGRQSADVTATAIHPLEWSGKKPRASVAGTFRPVAVQDNWRTKLQAHRIKFDDKAKAIYLAELERHGRKGDAARAAGVTPETVQRHIAEVDPDFAEAAEIAFQAHRDRIVSKIVHEAVDGVLVTKSRRVKATDGSDDWEEEVHREVRFETALRNRVLGSYAPEFRENSTVNIGSTGNAGGVLLIPMVKTMDEWNAIFASLADKKHGASET